MLFKSHIKPPEIAGLNIYLLNGGNSNNFGRETGLKTGLCSSYPHSVLGHSKFRHDSKLLGQVLGLIVGRQKCLLNCTPDLPCRLTVATSTCTRRRRAGATSSSAARPCAPRGPARTTPSAHSTRRAAHGKRCSTLASIHDVYKIFRCMDPLPPCHYDTHMQPTSTIVRFWAYLVSADVINGSNLSASSLKLKLLQDPFV